jgi:hypothetical protein
MIVLRAGSFLAVYMQPSAHPIAELTTGSAALALPGFLHGVRPACRAGHSPMGVQVDEGGPVILHCHLLPP